MINQQHIIIKMALDAWDRDVTRADKLFDSLSDEQLQEEVAPGRNSGIYILGHLIAVHDALFPLLGVGEKLYPQLEDIFIKNPDKSGIEKPSTKDLRSYWSEVNNKLSDHFNQFALDDWFQKHSAVSAGDFEKEPHRNKLNVLLNRTNHLAYHLGQLVFLKK
ncbi:MAG TPA: DinB family protein [Chitinophagaceae bacterium]|nr:DinB family protein [Chitinophagaceae bacterium]